jgi:hypothetical protein
MHRILQNEASMNVFFRFHKVVQQLQNDGVEYALVGGVAMAFHGPMRFTRDIDFLAEASEFDKLLEMPGTRRLHPFDGPLH